MVSAHRQKNSPRHFLTSASIPSTSSALGIVGMSGMLSSSLSHVVCQSQTAVLHCGQHSQGTFHTTSMRPHHDTLAGFTNCQPCSQTTGHVHKHEAMFSNMRPCSQTHGHDLEHLSMLTNYQSHSQTTCNVHKYSQPADGRHHKPQIRSGAQYLGHTV